MAATTRSAPTSGRATPSVLAALSLAGLLISSCAPAQLDQEPSGDGWRLLGWARGGEVRAPAVGEDASAAVAEMGLLRMAGRSAPLDPTVEVEVLVTHAVSGSCPQVRFDGFAVDHEADVVEALLTDAADLPFVGSCSADANPVVFWLAVDIGILSADGFTLRTEKAPDVTTEVPPQE